MIKTYEFIEPEAEDKGPSGGLHQVLCVWVASSLVMVFFLGGVLETGFLCVASSCPGTLTVDQGGLELRDPPTSAWPVLGLKAYATSHE